LLTDSLYFQLQNSGNGTYVNDARITPNVLHRLSNRDVIEIGRDAKGREKTAYKFRFFEKALIKIHPSEDKPSNENVPNNAQTQPPDACKKKDDVADAAESLTTRPADVESEPATKSTEVFLSFTCLFLASLNKVML
jgi:pSer/pThr/pTyr-binding forkhead associated (FHA) protein